MTSSSYHTKIVAQAIRLENNTKTGRSYLVFEILDPEFRQKIITSWSEDLDLEIDSENNLVLKDDSE